MIRMSEYSFVAAVLATGLALACYGLSFVALRVARMWRAGGGAGDHAIVAVASGSGSLGRYGTLVAWLAFAFTTSSLAFRAAATGHGPFANMYEFAIAFAWGVLAMHVSFEHRYRQRTLGLVTLPVALALMLYAASIPATPEPLVPALQNSLLLTVHVAVAIVAYGTFSVAFAAAVLYLVQPERGRRGLPRPALLDEIAHRAVVIGFPFLTLVIVLGAVWAEVAWGSYWSWDPKETAALVTWLIYGTYLHARVVRGWSGRRAAWLLVLGFAATLFTYFGNVFFGGLHSYSGLG